MSAYRIVLSLRIEFQLEGDDAYDLENNHELWLDRAAQYASVQAQKWFETKNDPRVESSAHIDWNWDGKPWGDVT